MKKKLDIEEQLHLIQIFGLLATMLLCLVLTISVTLTLNSRQQEEALKEESLMISRSKTVVSVFEGESNREYLNNYLDIYIKSIEDLDFVAVCDINNTCIYYPNKAFVGRTLSFGGEARVLKGSGPYIVTVERTGYSLEMAYAPVWAQDGKLLGYVVLSVFYQSPTSEIKPLLYLYMGISFGTAFLAIVLSASIRRRTLNILQGKRVEEYRRLTDERNEVLDALDEAIVAINLKGEVIMINKAFLKMVGCSEDRERYTGALQEIFPETVLLHVLETGHCPIQHQRPHPGRRICHQPDPCL